MKKKAITSKSSKSDSEFTRKLRADLSKNRFRYAVLAANVGIILLIAGFALPFPTGLHWMVQYLAGIGLIFPLGLLLLMQFAIPPKSGEPRPKFEADWFTKQVGMRTLFASLVIQGIFWILAIVVWTILPAGFLDFGFDNWFVFCFLAAVGFGLLIHTVSSRRIWVAEQEAKQDIATEKSDHYPTEDVSGIVVVEVWALILGFIGLILFSGYVLYLVVMDYSDTLAILYVVCLILDGAIALKLIAYMATILANAEFISLTEQAGDEDKSTFKERLAKYGMQIIEYGIAGVLIAVPAYYMLSDYVISFPILVSFYIAYGAGVGLIILATYGLIRKIKGKTSSSKAEMVVSTDGKPLSAVKVRDRKIGGEKMREFDLREIDNEETPKNAEQDANSGGFVLHLGALILLVGGLAVVITSLFYPMLFFLIFIIAGIQLLNAMIGRTRRGDTLGGDILCYSIIAIAFLVLFFAKFIVLPTLIATADESVNLLAWGIILVGIFVVFGIGFFLVRKNIPVREVSGNLNS